MPPDREPPVVVCRRTPTAPAMTGPFSRGAWSAAEVFGDFAALRATAEEPPRAPRLATRLRCLWDDERLYVGFECDSPQVRATKTRRDDELWTEPVCEVFLLGEPAQGTQGFFEFQVNPLGTIYDAYVADAAQKDDWRRWCRWDCRQLAAAAEVEPGELWRARLAIPWAALAAETPGCARPGAGPDAGRHWRANFCRYDYSEPSSEPELSSAGPVVAVFDDLGRFCRLEFTG